MQTPIFEILVSAKALITDPINRVTCTFALDANDLMADPIESIACKFCSLGAVLRIINVPTDNRHASAQYRAALTHLNDAALKLGYPLSVQVNDNQPHETVMKMWDLAIEMAKENTNA